MRAKSDKNDERKEVMQKADVKRFTVRIPPDVRLALKLRAVSAETSMGELVKGMITEYLAGGIRHVSDVRLNVPQTGNPTITGITASGEVIEVELPPEEVARLAGAKTTIKARG